MTYPILFGNMASQGAEEPVTPWEILLRWDGLKTETGSARDDTVLGNPGSPSFMSMTATSTGALNRTNFSGGEGLYRAFFNKKNITKIAIVDGSSTNLSTINAPQSNTNYLIYDLVSSTGNESINDILKRLDLYLRDNPGQQNNDSIFNGPSVTNFTAGSSGYSGLLSSSGGSAFRSAKRDGSNISTPDKFCIYGINYDSDNDAQALCAYHGNLNSGKGDAWRGANPEETFWSYWGHDFYSNSTEQRIGNARQTTPGVATQITSYSGSVYLLGYGAV